MQRPTPYDAEVSARLLALEAQFATLQAALFHTPRASVTLSYLPEPMPLLNKIQADSPQTIFDVSRVVSNRRPFALKVRITQVNFNSPPGYNYATFTLVQRGEARREAVFTVSFQEFKVHYNVVPFDFDVPWNPNGSSDLLVTVSGVTCDGTYSDQGNCNFHMLSVIGLLE